MNIPLLASSTLGLLGLCDALMRMIYLGWEPGLRAVVNDPGKNFFHIILLPALIYLMCRIPLTSSDLFARVRRSKVLRLVLGTLLFVVAVQVMAESQRAFFTKNATPEDLADRTARQKYQRARQGIAQLRSGVTRQPPITPGEFERIALEHGLASYLTTPISDVSTFTSVKARDVAYAISEGLTGKNTGWVSFVKQASLRRHVATMLHFSGVCVAAWLFFAICCAFFPAKQLSTRERDFLLLMVAIFSTWLPLKFYSEWHHQFYADSIDYGPFTIATIAVVAATVVIFVRSSKTIFTSVAPGAIACFSALSTLVFKNEIKTFVWFAVPYRNATWDQLLIIHAVVIMSLLAIGAHILSLLQPGGDSLREFSASEDAPANVQTIDDKSNRDRRRRPR